MLRGVDVSSFQGRPKRWRAAAGTITWAAVKITELEPNGTRYVNPDAADDWSWLHRNSKVRVGYLFGHPSTSARETVSFFLAEIRKLGLRDGDAIALDIEVTDGLGPSAVDAWCANVTSELHEKAGRRPVVYTFLSFAEAGNCSPSRRVPAVDRRSVLQGRSAASAQAVEDVDHAPVRHQRRDRSRPGEI